jgi:hypothetical protein
VSDTGEQSGGGIENIQIYRELSVIILGRKQDRWNI